MSRRLIATILAAGAALAAGISAAPASAGILVADAPGCDNGPTTQRFLPWGDPAQYFLVPGGDFADGSAFTTSGATIADGVATLPSGASVTSPTVCVGIEHPTMRFFARKASGGLLATLRVDVITELSTGDTLALPIGLISPGSSFQPSPVTLLVANLLPLLPGSHTPVELRFTAQGGTFQVDDVHVDPYGRT